MRKNNSQRKQFLRLISRKTKHQTLIARALLFSINTLRDIRRLLIQMHKNRASLSINTIGRLSVSNLLQCRTNNSRNVKLSFSRDFASHDNHAGLCQTFNRDTAVLIILQTRIKNSITYLITNLIRMTLSHRFRCKQPTYHTHHLV